MKALYEFWVWMKELFGFGNLGTIHVIDIDLNDESYKTVKEEMNHE